MANEAQDASQATVNGDNVQSLCDVARELPRRAVVDLWSTGMHLTVIWDQRQCLLSFSLSWSILSSLLRDSEKHLVDRKARELVVCSVCLGILQFSYSVEKKLVAERESADELAVSISNLIRQQGFQIDSFSLEVSVPPIIQENDRTGNDLDRIDKCSGFSTCEADAVVERSFVSLQANESRECLKLPLEQSSEPCCLEFLCYQTQIYIGGRYLKYSRNVSQTCWIIDDERMGDASVEEILGSNILPICLGDNYKFHAAGREDIDVRMLGSGRPFLLEIQNARLVPSDESVKSLETERNKLKNKLVGVKNLKLVDSQSWDLMREGEAEKQKQYVVLVWISCPLKDEDLHSISSLKDMMSCFPRLHIQQRTPIRVLHCRSPLEREQIIHWMRIEKIVGSSHYFLLHLCTQAGTYIKEFVHGDLGSNQPRNRFSIKPPPPCCSCGVVGLI